MRELPVSGKRVDVSVRHDYGEAHGVGSALIYDGKRNHGDQRAGMATDRFLAKRHARLDRDRTLSRYYAGQRCARKCAERNENAAQSAMR